MPAFLRALAVAGALLSCVPSLADAKINVTDMIATTVRPDAPCSLTNRPASWTQAGANADVCLALALRSATGSGFGLGDDVRDLKVSLPPGQVGSPKATPLCDTQRFRRTGCSSVSQVGTVAAAAETPVGLIDERVLKGDIFLITTTGTEAARLGVIIEALGIPAIHLEAELRLRPEDNGIDTIVTDNPRDFAGIPIELRRLAMRLWGSNQDHKNYVRPFLSSPSDCGQPATYKVAIRSYRGEDTLATRSPYTPTDCATLKMPVSLAVATSRASDVPTEVVADVRAADDGDAGRANATIKRAQIVLPKGFEVSAASGSRGLEGCTDEQFGYRTGSPVACPAASRVGTVTFESPLLLVDRLEGPIFLATPRPGDPKLRLFATAEAGSQADALRVKIPAVATIDPQTGQLTAVLDDLPPTPFTLFRFAFRGGPNALLATPRTCGTFTSVVDAAGFPGAPSVRITGDTTIDQGCKDPEPFAPELQTEISTPRAGVDSAIVATLGRPDGTSRLAGAVVTLPAGLAGRLDDVPACPVDTARAGACGEESRIGSVQTSAGVGPDPLSLPGGVYLTGPVDGAPAGMAVIAAAKVGPLDFGKVVVLAKIDVNADASLKMTFLDVPQRLEGIPLNLRALRLALDRPGFTFNATSCGPLAITARLTSDLGVAADLSSPYQLSGCETLAFAPKLAATASGSRADLAPGGNPKLRVTLENAPGTSNVRAAAITLPTGVSVDVTKLSVVCPQAVFDKGECPPSSVLGTVVARTPVLKEPLNGLVRFVSIPGVPLPELRIQVRGRINLDLAGKVSIDAQSRLVTTLDPVPDTPIANLEMVLGGKDSPLIVSKDLCDNASNPVGAVFTGWSGAKFTSTSQLGLTGCTPTATLRVSSLTAGRPRMDLRVAAGQSPVRQVELGLPAGLSYARAAAVRARVRVSAAGAGGRRATVTLSRGRLRVAFPSGVKATTVRVRVAAGAVRVSQRLRRAEGPRLRFAVGTRLVTGRTTTLRVVTRPT